MKTSSAVAQHSKINVALTGRLAQNLRSGTAVYLLGVQDREPCITLYYHHDYWHTKLKIATPEKDHIANACPSLSVHSLGSHESQGTGKSCLNATLRGH